VTWIFLILGLVIVVVIGLVVLGRETARLADVARPAVFDLTEAVDFIADRLPYETQARISHDDVRWVLLADADLLEDATAELSDDGGRESDDDGDDDDDDDRADDADRVGGDGGDGTADDRVVVDEDAAVARILELADGSGRDLADEDVVAVLDGRMAYLEAIGAIGPRADE
jgi:hypothetical protein